MADASKNKSFDEILREVGPDATATFDDSPSNPTEHASSEATDAATAVEGDDEDLEDDLGRNEDLEDEDGMEDDEAAELEEDDEEDEQEDVEDEAGV